jgi:hypothetical protein
MKNGLSCFLGFARGESASEARIRLIISLRVHIRARTKQLEASSGAACEKLKLRLPVATDHGRRIGSEAPIVWNLFAESLSKKSAKIAVIRRGRTAFEPSVLSTDPPRGDVCMSYAASSNLNVPCQHHASMSGRDILLGKKGEWLAILRLKGIIWGWFLLQTWFALDWLPSTQSKIETIFRKGIRRKIRDNVPVSRGFSSTTRTEENGLLGSQGGLHPGFSLKRTRVVRFQAGN